MVHILLNFLTCRHHRKGPFHLIALPKMTTLTYSARLALFLTTMIILERAASRVQGKASPNAATPDSNSSLTAVSGSKTTRGLPDKFIQSLNHLQQQLQGGIDHHDQDDMSENSAMYWLRIEMIKVKILAKLQMDKVPVIKEKQKESKIKELLASLNLTGEDDVDEKKEEEERNYFGRTTKIIVFSEKGRRCRGSVVNYPANRVSFDLLR